MRAFQSHGVLLTELKKQNVEYLVVGGWAVRHYCPKRDAGDLDLLINPTGENETRLGTAITNLANEEYFDSKKISEIKYNERTFRICLKPTFNVDILKYPDAINFKYAFQNPTEIAIDGNLAKIISCLDLIQLKENTCRYEKTDKEKDYRDLKCLRKVCTEKNTSFV